MDNSWVFDLETHIFSIVQKKVGDKLKSKYPNIRFTTTSNPKGVTVKYPTVYIHELPGAEKARTLEGEDISGILYSMQVEVSTDKSAKEAKAVLKEVALVYKNMGFEINSFPEESNGDEYYRCVMRVRRTLGNIDALH